MRKKYCLINYNSKTTDGMQLPGSVLSLPEQIKFQNASSQMREIVIYSEQNTSSQHVQTDAFPTSLA